MEAFLDTLKWKTLPPSNADDGSGLPHATHEGMIEIGSIRLRVYQLSTGERVIHEDDLAKFFGA